MTETDPALVSFEMDIYWAVNGGADPLALLARYPGRFKMLHVKDSLGPPDNKMTDVGAGHHRLQDRSSRAPRESSTTSSSHDQPADAVRHREASYQYLANLEF